MIKNNKALFLLAYGGISYLSYRYCTEKIYPQKIIKRSTLQIYNQISDSYDYLLEPEEKNTNVLKCRTDICSSLQGNVLEVCGGTGRNLDFIDKDKITSYVLVDFSEGMISQAKKKMEEKGWITSEVTNVNKAEVMDSRNLRFEDNSFDYVVQTFGMCSVDRPLDVLDEIVRVCKEDGHIVLLEHGLSTWWPVSWFLNSNVERHYNKFGCRYNKDITAIVNDMHFVETIRHERFDYGTMHLIVLKKKTK